MNSLSKTVLILVVLGGVAYGGFYLLKHRYDYFFKGGDIETVKEFENIDRKDNKNNKDNQSADTNSEEGEGDNVEEEEGYFSPAIHKSDCRQECKNRQAVKIEYEYCREVCGFNEIRSHNLEDSTSGESNNVVENKNVEITKTEEECEDIENAFKQDVCWKKRAVEEKNASYCNNISDEQMGKIC